MHDSINRLSQFWSELKRRKVIKVVAMYAATAFIILEVVDIITPALLLPSWTVSLVIVLLAIGFPIAVILSWIFDVTPEGIRKTDSIGQESKPARRGVKASDVLIAVLFVAVCVLIYPKLFSNDKFENIREEDGRISIAVMPFQNLTNDTLWNVWQVGIQNELITKLSNSTELSVRQYQTMQEILQNSDQVNYASITPSLASEISRKLEANTFIQGSIKSAGSKIRLSAHLIDASNEEVFKTFQIEGYSEGDVFGITDSLSRLVRNYLEIKVMEQEVEYDLRLGLATSSAEAYRNYIEGLNYYFTGDDKSALERLNQAIILDPDFFAAYDWLLEVYNRHGGLLQDYSQIEHAKLLLQKLKVWQVDKLTRMEQLSLKMIVAKYVDKSPQEYIRNCRQMLEFDPQQRIIWYKLGSEYSKIQQYEYAAEAFEKAVDISNQWGVSNKWVRPYQKWIGAYHSIGDHQKEEELAELGLQHFPNHPDMIISKVLCALSQGDTIEAKEYFTSYELARREENFWSHARAVHSLAHQAAHANLLDKAEETWRSIIQMEPQVTYHQRCFAEFLILNDVNVEEGLDLVNNILKEDPDYYDILFFKGVGLFKQGYPEEALKTLQTAWDKRFTYRHDHYLAILEAEKALASQNN